MVVELILMGSCVFGIDSYINMCNIEVNYIHIIANETVPVHVYNNERADYCMQMNH
jgi:hypothetical protein